MNIRSKRQLTSTFVAAVAAIGLAIIPAAGAQAQGIVYKTYCGVNYTGFSNQGTVQNGGLVASTRRASTGCGGSIYVTARSGGSPTYLGTTYSAGNYVSQTTNGVYYSPGATHGSPAGSFAS